MMFLDIMKEAAALAGYTITGSSGADPVNKTRAQRRVNMIKADVISRYGGKWDANYREGWLPLVPLYNTGTLSVTQGSRTVTGSGTTWLTGQTFNSSKILLPDGAYYKIASVVSDTSLVMTQPYQGVTLSGKTYQIWQDEYRLYPEVLTLAGFVDYQWQATMDESWPRNMKQSYPVPVNNEIPTVYTVIGRQGSTVSYTTGTVTGTINDNFLTGGSTSWLANLEPGMEVTTGTNVYHIKRVISDTSIELYQRLVVAVTNSAYSAKAKNSLIVRFREPASQRIVHYWYWAKDYPFINDTDEDWIAETFPRVIINGIAYFDYVDKNDVARATTSHTIYEDSIKNMKVAIDSAMSGPRTLGYNIPPEARD